MTSPLTPKEIEAAIKDGMTTAAVNDQGTRLTLTIRPRNSSRVFILMSQIEQVDEL